MSREGRESEWDDDEEEEYDGQVEERYGNRGSTD